jgi:hypothetical protein
MKKLLHQAKPTILLILLIAGLFISVYAEANKQEGEEKECVRAWVIEDKKFEDLCI